jgi:hypothetical protein
VVARQEQADGRADALLALDLDVAARLLDEAIDHRQAKARALPQRLGRVEGIEDLGSTSAGMPRPVSVTLIST